MNVIDDLEDLFVALAGFIMESEAIRAAFTESSRIEEWIRDHDVHIA